ncbi:MAG: prepilin-type N-terminal cleavage/methylation domain-containing protein [Methylophilus sp.]|uniref:prepilin-type N-terminal cleavage/methylation domain-containing protein n=1 Tax=Methylophilus sp. TaxID=29541 RepID=UPI003F9FE986
MRTATLSGLGNSIAMKGFTLVELVVVIALLAILAAVAAPRFASGDIFETRGDAGLLASSIRYAQKTAIAQRKIVYVIHTASPLPGKVSLCFDPGCNQAVINPETGGAYIFSVSKNVEVLPSNASLGFDSLGRAVPDIAASYKVINKKNFAQVVNILVEANTGYIH